jgi:3-deoxy-D-manno-octulosonic acid kinase
LVAAPALYDALAERLAEYDTLYAWAEAAPQPRALQGRGVVYVAELSECATTLAVRHAWHGGLLAPITGDRFLRPTRAPREAAVNITLRQHGIPTPELLAYAMYAAGPGLRRVDVATRYVPDAWDFGAVMLGTAPGIAQGEAERAVLVLLSQLAEARALHTDLNVKNILLVPEQGGVAAWVLDVDVVSFREQPAITIMARNVRRLMRSVRKWHRQHERHVDETWLEGFRQSALAATP